MFGLRPGFSDADTGFIILCCVCQVRLILTPMVDLSIFGTTCTVLNDALVLKRVVCIIYVCVYIYVPFLSIVVQVQHQIMILLEVIF